MGVAPEDFLQGIAAKLTELYPDYKVYAGAIGQHGYNNCFYITCRRARQTRIHPTRFKRTYSLQVLFFQEDNEQMEFQKWADNMLLNFYELEAGGSRYHTWNFEAVESDGSFQCLFDAHVFTRQVMDDTPMEQLNHDPTTKGNERPT